MTDSAWPFGARGIPPARILSVPGRGEFFIRDSGGSGTPLLLLHGWMFSADLNWGLSYEPLAAAGYRVIAMDHRGHGRGLRSRSLFRLADCAADCAAVLREADAPGAIVVGYSMGGAIAQLLAHEHRSAVAGLVMCATSARFDTPLMKRTWRAMPALRVALGLGGVVAWERTLVQMGFPKDVRSKWVAAELSRGSAADMAESGRELGRHNASSLLSEIHKPAASVITTRDNSVPPSFQRDLAAGLKAEVFEIDADHMASATHTEKFNRVLLSAIGSVEHSIAAAKTPA